MGAGADAGIRTPDLPLTRRLLCRLSYVGAKSDCTRPIYAPPASRVDVAGKGPRDGPRHAGGAPCFSVDLTVVSVDHVVFRLVLLARGLTVRPGGTSALVDVLADLLQRLVELVHGLSQLSGVSVLAGGLERIHLGLDLGLDVGRDPLLVLLEHLLSLVDHLVGLVAELDLLSLAAVLRGVRLGF